jgi:hypothetical protein
VNDDPATDDPALGRRLGAALGALGGPAAGYGASWAGLGDTRAHVWALAILLGALLGAMSWRVFVADRAEVPRLAPRFGIGFAALFAAVVGMLAGAFAAFPIGGLFGFVGGAAGAVPAVLAWRATPGFGPALRPLVAAGFGVGGSLCIAAWWAA